MHISRMLGLACVLFALSATAASAQSNPRYIPFDPSATKGALYVPDSGPRPHIAFLVIHRTGNFMVHAATEELARRGFMVLGMNPRSDNNEAAVHFEDIALDIKQGVAFLRRQPGITRVILIGHSGGGPSTSYYEAVAENGPAYCEAPDKLSQCTNAVAGLPKADAIVFMDAHPGNGVNRLRSLNPAVTDETKPGQIDAALDPFNPKNGFNPNGESTYSPEFLQRYYKAQSVRMNALIAKAEALKAEMKAGRHIPANDDVFTAYRDTARMADISVATLCCTLKPAKLIRNDGSIDASAIVKTVRMPHPENARSDPTLGGAMQLTIDSFLSANAIRSTDSIEGIDWCSSNNSTVCAVRRIAVPTLVLAMQAHYFIRDGETIYENVVAKDKDFAIVEGAIHGLAPCVPCSRVTGRDYGNARKNLFDYVAKWANARF